VDQEIQKEIKKVTIRIIRIAGISLLLGKGPSIRTKSEIVVYWRVNGKERTAYLGTSESEIASVAVEIIKESRELPSGLQWWYIINSIKEKGWIDIDNPENLIPVMALIGAVTLTARYHPWRVVKGPVRKLIRKLIDSVINGNKETIEKARDLMDDKRVKRAMQRLAEGRFEDKEVLQELREVLEELVGEGDTLDEWIYEGGEEPKTEKT